MNFKQHRVSNNLTQEQVAQDVGVQRTTVAMWESGKSRPRAELLPKLAKLFGWRQAYNYIQVYERLSPQLLEQNAGLGVTKLLLLTQVSAPDRAEFAGENDLAGMTVEEIKALISEKNGLAQQISMLETEKADAENSETFLKKEVARLQAESREKDELLEKLRQEPVETCAEEGGDAEQCVDLDAVRAEAAMAARAEAQKLAEAEKAEAVRAARADEREKAKKAAEKAQADAVKKAEEAAAARAKAQAEQERAELENAAKQAEERAHELEKRLEIAGDQDTLRFSLLFEGIQRDMNTALGLLNSMRGKGNTDKADKLGSAMAQLLGQAAELARDAVKRAVLLTVENHLRQYRRLQRRQDREARAWCDAVRETLEEYETGGEPMKARLLVLRYFDGLTEESVMDFINARPHSAGQRKERGPCAVGRHGGGRAAPAHEAGQGAGGAAAGRAAAARPHHPRGFCAGEYDADAYQRIRKGRGGAGRGAGRRETV